MTDLEKAMLTMLKRILAAWEAVPEDEIVPDSINVNEMWDEVRELIATAEPRRLET